MEAGAARVVMVAVSSLLLGLVDAVVRDGASREQAVRVAVQVASRLQVGPLGAVAQVALAQVPQRVALLHAPTEQLVARVRRQMVAHAFVASVRVVVHAMDIRVRRVVRRHGVRLSDFNVLALPLPHDDCNPRFSS